MDTMRVQWTEWFDEDVSDYNSAYEDIDTGELYYELEDAKEYAKQNNLILEVIDNGY